MPRQSHEHTSEQHRIAPVKDKEKDKDKRTGTHSDRSLAAPLDSYVKLVLARIKTRH